MFPLKLGEGSRQKDNHRQGVLTVGRQASGSIPNAGEGGVRLEEVCHDLRAINTELVASDAANDNQTKASEGADAREMSMRLLTGASPGWSWS